VAGYAAALEAFDRRLPALIHRLRPDDLLIITADHGCDPTWHGTDHTGEQVPILAMVPKSGADRSASARALLILPRPAQLSWALPGTGQARCLAPSRLPDAKAFPRKLLFPAHPLRGGAKPK
jgi:hypothetical protein